LWYIMYSYFKSLFRRCAACVSRTAVVVSNPETRATGTHAASQRIAGRPYYLALQLIVIRNNKEQRDRGENEAASRPEKKRIASGNKYKNDSVARQRARCSSWFTVRARLAWEWCGRAAVVWMGLVVERFTGGRDPRRAAAAPERYRRLRVGRPRSYPPTLSARAPGANRWALLPSPTGSAPGPGLTLPRRPGSTPSCWSLPSPGLPQFPWQSGARMRWGNW